MRQLAKEDPAGHSIAGTTPPTQHRVSLQGLAAALNRPPIVTILWLLALMHLGWVFSRLPTRENKIDFGYYYLVATALHQGVNPYTARLDSLSRKLGLEVDPPLQIAETPPLLVAIAPLARLPLRAAYWVWWSVSFGALCVSMILLLRRVGPGASTLGALMLLYPPLTEHLLLAQTQLLILFLLVLLLLALERGDDVVAGALLALAGALRAYPLAMGAYLLLTRRWRALAFSIFFLVAITCATIAILGWRLSFSWIQSAFVATGFALNPEDIAVNAFLARFFLYFFGLPATGIAVFPRYALTAVAEVTLLIMSARATLSCPSKFGFPVWVVTAIVLSPIAWTHFLILLFIPFTELASAANQGVCSGRAIWAMIASYALTTALYIAMGLMPIDKAFRTWVWIGQGLTISALLAYVSTYWLAIDSADTLHHDDRRHPVGAPASAAGA